MTKFATGVFDATASAEFNRQQIARELRRHRFSVSDDLVGQIYDDLLRKVAV